MVTSIPWLESALNFFLNIILPSEYQFCQTTVNQSHTSLSVSSRNLYFWPHKSDMVTQSSGQCPSFICMTSQVQILAYSTAIVTEIFHGFCQNLHAGVLRAYALSKPCSPSFMDTVPFGRTQSELLSELFNETINKQKVNNKEVNWSSL